MAIVTVTVTLRRTEGRTPVNIEDLDGAVGDALRDLLVGEEVMVESAGEDLIYEITKVQVPITIEAETVQAESQCQRCGKTIANDRNGRQRRYCSDACRQSAYRTRRA